MGGHKINSSKFYIATGVIWSLAMGSLLGLHYLLKERPSNPIKSAGDREFFEGLPDELKKGISRFENGLIRLEDGKLQIIGTGFEPDEEKLAENKVLVARKIDFNIDDRVALERKIMAEECFKTLNNSEKICYAEGYAAIIFRGGQYYLLVNSDVYKKYASKYGTECTTCEKLKKKNITMGGHR